MSACGRKRTVIFLFFGVIERPLWRKADINDWASEIGVINDRFTPESGHWARLGVNDR